MPICTQCHRGEQPLDQFLSWVTNRPTKLCLSCRAISIRYTRKHGNRNNRHEYNRGVNYGLERGDYARMLAEQNGVCAICKRKPEECKVPKRLAVDHDKLTHHVRGLLCFSCNVGIGHLEHNPEILASAKIYLERTYKDIELTQKLVEFPMVF